MADKIQAGMQCAEFEGLLSDALDGLLSGAQAEKFEVHRQQCSVCGPMFAEGEAGMHWLKRLHQVQPPANLVRSILAATTGVETRAPVLRAATPSWLEIVRDWATAIVTPVWGTVHQPRFAMSFAMVFFSVSIGLNLAGVKLSEIRHVDLRPSALARGYHGTSARVVKYYENIRFVYEIESRVRDLRRATEPEQNTRPTKEKNHKNNSSEAPDHKRNQNYYSRGESQPLLASMQAEDPSLWPVSALRRNS